MYLELKKELEAILASAGESQIDASAARSKGKILFKNRELYDFANFDVLGLSQDPRVKRRAQEAIESAGISNNASRKNAGTSTFHLLCEKALANFFGYEKALLFSSKNQVVFSLLATLLKEQDVVFCDSDSAGLLSDVCLLINCALEIVDLNSLPELEKQLSVPLATKRKFVFADAISNSSGRKIDLSALSSICAKHNVILINDESLACGIFGVRGAGVLDENQSTLSPTKPFCMISDLGYGLGSYGACLCGSTLLIGALAARSKTLSSEPSFPPHLAASIEKAIEVCEVNYTNRALVSAKLEFLKANLNKIKQCVECNGSSFVSLKFSKNRFADEFCKYLFSKGFYCDFVTSPARLSENAYVRLVPSFFHSDQVIQDLIANVAQFFSKARV